jgi:hypothetical protein
MARSARKPILVFCILSSIAFGAFACGGVDSDLFAGLPIDGGNVADAGGDARNKSDAARSDAGGGGNDGGGGGKDSGPKPGSVVPTLCGSSLNCTSSSPTCCATQTNNGLTTTSTYSCTSNASSCNATGDAPVACRDQNDCSGQLCCGELFDPTATNGYQHVICESTCVAKDDAGAFTAHIPFCTIGQIPDVCAPSGLTCQASSIMPGFNVCGGD